MVLKRKLPFNIVERYSCEEGRVSYIKTVIAGMNLAFLSIYAPSHFDPNILPALTTTLMRIQDCFLIIGVDISLDSSSVQHYPMQSLSSVDLCKCISDLSLIDAYCINA